MGSSPFADKETAVEQTHNNRMFETLSECSPDACLMIEKNLFIRCKQVADGPGRALAISRQVIEKMGGLPVVFSSADMHLSPGRNGLKIHLYATRRGGRSGHSSHPEQRRINQWQLN